MTPPVRPQTDHLKVIESLRSQGATDNDVEAYLKSVGAQEVAPSPTQTRVRQALKSPAGKERLAAGNQGQFEAEMPTLTDYAKDQASGLAAGGAALLKDVPGGEAAQAALRSLVRGQPYREALSDIQGAEEGLSAPARIGARMLGTSALTPILPASGPVAGAILGGTGQLLSSDPESGVGGRLGRAAVGAGIGGLAGAAADRLVTGGRALVAGNAAKTRMGMLADRAKSAKDLYDAALAEGQNLPTPKAVSDFLQEPDIAAIVQDLKGTRPFTNVREDSPEMLDAIYKNLSDKAGMLKGKLGALTPRGANLGRVAQKDVEMAQGGLLNAVETPTPPTGFPNDPGRKALMPSYRGAVQDYATRSKGIESFDTGYDALRAALSPNAVSAKNLTRANKTPEAFADLLKSLSPADAAAAREGVLGMASAHPGGLRLSSMGPAAKLLRSTDAATGTEAPRLTRQSLLALLAQLAPQ